MKKTISRFATFAALLTAQCAFGAASGGPLGEYSVLVYPVLVLLFFVLTFINLWIILTRMGRALAGLFHRTPAQAPGTYVPPEKETSPTCGADLIDGECAQGNTIVRCSKYSAIIKGGVCPRCGVGGEQEFCPTCNSELVDGECPRGHTIVRCPDCGSILSEGICPKGCNADPLNLGWPGGTPKKLGVFALEVVTCPKSEGAGFTLRVPDSYIIGRNATDAREPFVELLTITRKEKTQCSRQYVHMNLDPDGAACTVTLLNSSRNPTFVNGAKIARQNETAKLKLGEHIKLNPGYELALVEAPADATPVDAVPVVESDAKAPDSNPPPTAPVDDKATTVTAVE